ncbi:MULTISPECIES: hypothetical protein [Rhizobium]|uniref:hypothetical protein n=1 Tax=Rhizobium TaxID=379 RepID=UPI00135635E9
MLGSVPGDDGHQVIVVLARIAAEIGVEPGVACVDAEGEIVAAILVPLFPDAADLDMPAAWALGEKA